MKRDIKTCRIGDRGRANSALAPSGVVEIDGEIFSARAKGPAINTGDQIVVSDGDIGGLVVIPFRPDVPLDSMPRFGELAYDSFGDRANAVAAREAQERLDMLEAWQRTGRKRQLQIGFCFSAATVWLANPILVTAEFSLVPRVVIGLMLFVAALFWAIIVFRAIDRITRQFDEEFIGLISLSACISLLGSCFGLWSMQSLGISLGLGLAFFGAFVGAGVMPLFALIFLSGGE